MRFIPLAFACLTLASIAAADELDAGTFAPSTGDVASSDAGASSIASLDRPLVAILPFESNEEGAEEAAGVTSLLAGHLAEDASLRVAAQSDVRALLSVEKQRAMLGVSDGCEGECLEQVSQLVGARYLVTGRLDRFGKRYAVTATLIDASTRQALARPTAEASRAETLPAAVRKVASALMTPLGAALSSSGDPLLELETDPDAGEWAVGLRLSNSFIRQLAALNPGADLDVMYRVHHAWHGFLQVGFKLRRAEQSDGDVGVSVLPSVVGVRHFHRLESELQPYWGAGFGIQLAFGNLGIFQSTGPLPTVIGFGGVRYRFRDTVAFSIEGGTNVAQLLLGFAGGQLGSGLNIDVTGGVSYLF